MGDFKCLDCGTKCIHARGLCSRCYHQAAKTGRLIDYERLYRPRDEVLTEWADLRDDGHSPHEAAQRIGVTFAALDRALCRAKRRGDPRGSRVPFAHDTKETA